MTLGWVVFLSFIQGFTEFFPVSSSGHLAIFPHMFGITMKNMISFDVFLHLGTLGAVVLFLWKDLLSILKRMVKHDTSVYQILLKIIITLIPASIAGLLLNDQISRLFEDIFMVGYIGYAFLGTAFLLFISIFFLRGKKTLETFSYLDAVVIGIFQAFALVPGFSRSGFTIFGALLIGLKRKEAFKYSFLVSIPVILGASLFELKGLQAIELPVSYLITGFTIAMVSGLIALVFLRKLLIQAKLWLFGLYCTVLGILVLGLFF